MNIHRTKIIFGKDWQKIEKFIVDPFSLPPIIHKEQKPLKSDQTDIALISGVRKEFASCSRNRKGYSMRRSCIQQ
jgi:hypothetical protein